MQRIFQLVQKNMNKISIQINIFGQFGYILYTKVGQNVGDQKFNSVHLQKENI